MESSSETHQQRLLKAAYRQIVREIEELVESAAEVPRSKLVEQALGGDDELCDQLRERFEQGKSSGKFSLLSGYLSDLSDEEHEEFFRTGWLQMITSPPRPLKEPWDYSPYNGNEDWYREDLYDGVAFAITDLRSFAQEWLKELSRVGYHGVGGPSRLPLKQRVDGSAITTPAASSGDTYPVFFENSRQVLWLQLDGERPVAREYREVRVSDEPLRTDKAILAALTALEGRPIDIERLRKALPELKLPLDRSMWAQWHEALKDLPEPYGEPGEFKDHFKQRGKQLEESNVPGGLQSHQVLDYVLLLLRHYRPEFDDLPHQEKLKLIVQVCARVNEFLEALRRFESFLEYGIPGRPRKSAAKDADRDVKAAVLRGVDGLTYREIGEELGVPPPEDIDYMGDHPTVRQMVKRGRRLLERALGKEGWQSHIGTMKAEAKRRHALSQVERDAEDTAESLGIPYEEALQRAQEEQARIEELRNSKNRPEND